MNTERSFIDRVIDRIKWFAEIEKGVWIHEGITFDNKMAAIRLVVVLVGFFACILSWLICSR